MRLWPFEGKKSTTSGHSGNLGSQNTETVDGHQKKSDIVTIKSVVPGRKSAAAEEGAVAMADKGTVINNILNDIALIGSLAASIFVKNSAHQEQAANIINAVSKILQVIEPQIESTSTAATPQPAAPASEVVAQAPIVSSALAQ